MEEINTLNPWLGLESYKEGEILYGRDDDIRDLSQYVLNDTNTLLYGKSGIGKSSILNAGILPAARRHGYLPVIIRLSHKDSESYLDQILSAIFNAISSSESELNIQTGINTVIREVVPCINPEKESLYEFFHRYTFHKSTGELVKLLIIFDQFEEIFTLQEDNQKIKMFFSHLADLLNDVMPGDLQHKVDITEDEQEVIEVVQESDFDNIFDDINLSVEHDFPEYLTDIEHHFVFTIREDFLSDFEYYSANIPSFKQNRYGLRPINEEQAAQIILKPRPGMINEAVAKLIIEKITGRTDFDLNGVPEIEVDAAVLSLYLSRLFDAKEGDTITSSLVEQKGKEIICEFYNDALSGISASTIEYLEDMLLNGKGRRDNITIYDAIHEGKVTEAELQILCDEKKVLRKFNYAGELRIEYIHDILCSVVKQHKEDRIYLKQQEEERLRELKERNRIIIEEKRKRKEIELRAAEEKKRLEEEAELIKRKNKKKFRLLYSCVNAVIVLVIGWWILFVKPYSNYYPNFTTVNGWPVGLGDEVKKNTDKEHLVTYYKLTRVGFSKKHPYSRVEVLDAKGKAATNIFYSLPIVGLLEAESSDQNAREFSLLQRKTSQWVYSSNDVKKLVASKCTAYDIDGNELYSLQFSHDKTYDSNDKSKYVQWVLFYDGNGSQMIVTDNGIDRMRQTVDNGLVTGCLFFTKLGVPQKNVSGVYGYHYIIDDKIKLAGVSYRIDKFGARIDSSKVEYFYDSNARIASTSLYHVDHTARGIIKRYEHYSDTLMFYQSGRLSYGNIHMSDEDVSRIVFKYDETQRLLFRSRYVNDILTESREYKYISDTETIQECLSYENSKYILEKYSYPCDGIEIQTFWMNGQKTSCYRYVEEWRDFIEYHERTRIVSKDSLYHIETVEYRDVHGNLTECSKGCAKYTIKRDVNTGNPRLKYHYDSSSMICKSEWNDYDEYGNKVSRAVAGIDGTPVRSSDWDWDGFCYYKMAVLKDFSDEAFVAIQGLNEFDEHSYVVDNNDLYELSELPLSRTDYQIDTNVYESALTISKENKEPIGNRLQVPYIHIADTEGTVYKSRTQKDMVVISEDYTPYILDGDIILKLGTWNLYESSERLASEWKKLSNSGGGITILRPDDAGYKKIMFNLSEGYLGAKYYMMPITPSERERLNNFK